ncbi:MAG: SWIM zinc finger domain-containing protein, partial [Sphaerospermopsis kisseleviana]
DLVHKVMDAAIPHRPDWVISTARKRAEPIMNEGKADRYESAVRWLKKAKIAYYQMGKQAEWSAYKSQLESERCRKRKLMGLFKEILK